MMYLIVVFQNFEKAPNKFTEVRSGLFLYFHLFTAWYTNCYEIKIKGKGHPITGHEGPEVKYRYRSTLSLTSAPYAGWVVNATLRPLYPRERPGTHCTEG